MSFSITWPCNWDVGEKPHGYLGEIPYSSLEPRTWSHDHTTGFKNFFSFFYKCRHLLSNLLSVPFIQSSINLKVLFNLLKDNDSHCLVPPGSESCSFRARRGTLNLPKRRATFSFRMVFTLQRIGQIPISSILTLRLCVPVQSLNDTNVRSVGRVHLP